MELGKLVQGKREAGVSMTTGFVLRDRRLVVSFLEMKRLQEEHVMCMFVLGVRAKVMGLHFGLLTYFMCMSILPACMNVHQVGIVPEEVRKEPGGKWLYLLGHHDSPVLTRNDCAPSPF